MPIKRVAPLVGRALLALIVLAAVVRLFMPGRHRPLEYMVAGTAVTGVALAVVFALLNRNSISHK